MSWKKELEEKVKREKLSEKLGGSERVKRQHNSGRYTVRERIHLLTDKNSFQEVGKIAGKAIYDDNNDVPTIYNNLLENKMDNNAIRLGRKNNNLTKGLF